MNEQTANISLEDMKKLSVLIDIIKGVGKLTRDITLQLFINEYTAYAEKNLSNKSSELIKLSFKHLLTFFPPNKSIHLITQIEVEKFLDQVRKKAAKGYYVYFRTLMAAFNKAKDWDYISENPFSKIKLPKKQINKPAYLTSADFKQVLEKIQIKVVKDISKLCFYTGLRLGEATYLKWRNIDLKNKLITVGDSEFKTKTSKQRIVPMNPIVEQIFTKRLDEQEFDKDEFVFKKRKHKPFTTNFISKRFKKACRDAGLDEAIHFHSLRHSAATNMVQSNAPITTVKEILGHSSISTTMIYMHTGLDAMRAAINLIK